jgi:hypothetical protein
MKTIFHIFSFRKLLLLSLFFTLTFTSCHRDNFFGIHGSGATVTQVRPLGSFNAVELSIDANVILHVDSDYHIVVQGQQNILNVLSTEVHGNELKIKFIRNVSSHSNITIDVYAPAYASVSISGSGDIHNNESWSISDFETSISGSGTIDISGLQTNSIRSSISGSGSITLSGNCQSLRGVISGSGDLHAFSMSGLTSEIDVSGSGKTELNITQSIDVQISGSGDVYYRNNPTITASISGSGRLVHVQ